MIYHGSPVQDLKIIKPNKSTQKGEYVYGTPNQTTAALFAAIKILIDESLPPICKSFTPNNFTIIERFENQFNILENKNISIYILDEKNFLSFTNASSGHSSGDEIEVRSKNEKEPQEVKSEIKINNVLDFLQQNNVNLIKYKDRQKEGIPQSDKYIIPGVLKTYLWKIEGRQVDNFIWGNVYLKDMKERFAKFLKQTDEDMNILDETTQIINNLTDKEAYELINNIYEKEKDIFNTDELEKQKELLFENNSSKKRH